MAKTVNLRLSGQAEKFTNKLIKKGFTEREIFARAIWLLEMAVKTKKVALLGSSGQPKYVFSLETLSESSEEGSADRPHDEEKSPGAVYEGEPPVYEVKAGEYYEVSREEAAELYQTAAEMAAETEDQAKKASATAVNPFTAAIEAGKEAYEREKRERRAPRRIDDDDVEEKAVE